MSSCQLVGAGLVAHLGRVVQGRLDNGHHVQAHIDAETRLRYGTS